MFLASALRAVGAEPRLDAPDPGPFLKRWQRDRSATNKGNGGSMIVAPGGAIVAGPIIGEEKILYAEVDAELVMGEHLKLDPAGHCSDE
jgi:nitrilase